MLVERPDAGTPERRSVSSFYSAGVIRQVDVEYPRNGPPPAIRTFRRRSPAARRPSPPTIVGDREHTRHARIAMTFTNYELPARHHGAKSLLLTLHGEFVYPTGGSVWT